tara:strand:- start:2884 stop:3096 length:213 start_codon:yes stop_codon:yes gene_type:complete
MTEINVNEEIAKAALKKNHGRVWTTSEMVEEFDVKHFLAPFVSVVRKSDGVKGTLMFSHRPRFYFKFKEV